MGNDKKMNEEVKKIVSSERPITVCLISWIKRGGIGEESLEKIEKSIWKVTVKNLVSSMIGSNVTEVSYDSLTNEIWGFIIFSRLRYGWAVGQWYHLVEVLCDRGIDGPMDRWRGWPKSRLWCSVHANYICSTIIVTATPKLKPWKAYTVFLVKWKGLNVNISVKSSYN